MLWKHLNSKKLLIGASSQQPAPLRSVFWEVNSLEFSCGQCLDQKPTTWKRVILLYKVLCRAFHSHYWENDNSLKRGNDGHEMHEVESCRVNKSFLS